MAKRKSKSSDFRNPLIAVLLLIIGIETYALWNKDRPLDFKSAKEEIQARFTPDKKERTAAAKPKLSVKPREEVRKDPVRQTAEVEPSVPVRRPAAKPIVRGAGGRIAFIIDDWGYTTNNCRYLREIESPITVAVLPSLRHTLDVIECARASRKEIMLHLPLEPHHNSDAYPEDYIIETSMSEGKADRILDNILKRMPHIVGVNNHMGSAATEDRKLMSVVFRNLKERKLFFVDSFVTSKTICPQLAKEFGLEFAQRDVFLDNKNERRYIEGQIEILAQTAERNGYAIAIGHDRELTMQIIKEQIPILQQRGFQIVTVKEIIRSRQ